MTLDSDDDRIDVLREEYDTPYFNFNEIDGPSNEYVCWVDIMGTRSALKKSMRDLGIFFGKMHSILVDNLTFDEITLYPVMDGAYIVTSNQSQLIAFLDEVFSTAAAICLEHEYEHNLPVFPIRASIAFGPVIHGQHIPESASWTLADDDDHWYRDMLLLGMPMIQAAESESKALPFGIYVHESARAFAPSDSNPLYHVWWTWYDNDHEELAAELYVVLENYFQNCLESHHRIPNYSKKDIEEHQEQLREYFIKDGSKPDGEEIEFEN